MSGPDGMVPPRRFQGATLDNFQPQHPSQEAALAKVREWVEAAARGEDGPMLALVGKKGRGKSHLLWGARRALVERLVELESAGGPRPGWRPMARSWYDLAPRLERRAEGRADAWRHVKGVRCLMLDEVRPIQVGSQEAPDRDLTALTMHAYDGMVAMFVTTNKKLEEVVGEAAASRFVLHVVDGPNWRDR